MAKYIQITRLEFHLLHSAAEEKQSLSEGADCEGYMEETKRTNAAVNRIIDRNSLNQGLKIDPTRKFILK